jgi:hypothetical protein
MGPINNYWEVKICQMEEGFDLEDILRPGPI